MTSPSQRPALLVVGHGSRDLDGIQEFCKLAEHLNKVFPERLCATGFLEFATPLISDGVEALVQQGATRITAVPGMLMAAGHAKNDIPSELNTLQAQYPGVKITYGVELGVHAKMLRAAAARIEEAEAALINYRREDTLLLVVGRGASDSDANSNIAKITRMLWEGMGFGWAETCYIGVTYPLMEEALERTARLGFKNVVVVPYFLFTGRLVKKIYGLADEFQARQPQTRVIKAPYLNDHPLVLEALIDRLHEAEAGTGNMNCQLCQYREQILGFEARQGQPQEGHHHHVRGAGTDADHHHHRHHHDSPFQRLTPLTAHHHHDHGHHGHHHHHAPEEASED